ncbi:unnamed protein product [Protopolystoma xenopodis]|uniref:Uncharacterized protein n=1 Tax=Protopolystoma xenopodis TaxID=117903 RepID=A0A3S5CSW6_9PLAT|nr:unnamed protein product [Protopolystoma xenopodis]
MSSAIVLVIYSARPVAGYIPKRFADIVVGIVSERRHRGHRITTYQLLWHRSSSLFFALPSSAVSFSLNPTSHRSFTYSYNSMLAFPQMSSKSVSLQVGLVKRNNLHYLYQMLFAGLPHFFSHPLVNWQLLNLKTTVWLSEIWLPKNPRFPSSITSYSRI